MGTDLLLRLFKPNWAKIWNFLFETTETIVTKLCKNTNSTIAKFSCKFVVILLKIINNDKYGLKCDI